MKRANQRRTILIRLLVFTIYVSATNCVHCFLSLLFLSLRCLITMLWSFLAGWNKHHLSRDRSFFPLYCLLLRCFFSSLRYYLFLCFFFFFFIYLLLARVNNSRTQNQNSLVVNGFHLFFSFFISSWIITFLLLFIISWFTWLSYLTI